MSHAFEPQLQPAEISTLRPTQMTIGYREVAEKREEWRHHADRDRALYLGRHMVPVVIGPKGRAYLVDNHHLVRALHEEGVAHVLTSVVSNLGHLGKSEFWSVLDHRHWMYPFDSDGQRRTHDDLPRTIAELTDDPYRSLAGSLRSAGGYAKDPTPYSEFIWADYLRRRIDAAIVRDNYDAALDTALSLARGRDAGHLPGWCGVTG